MERRDYRAVHSQIPAEASREHVKHCLGIDYRHSMKLNY